MDFHQPIYYEFPAGRNLRRTDRSLADDSDRGARKVQRKDKTEALRKTIPSGSVSRNCLETIVVAESAAAVAAAVCLCRHRRSSAGSFSFWEREPASCPGRYRLAVCWGPGERWARAL